VVALAGLVGAGRSEVARAVFGIDRRDGGTVTVDGRPLPAGKPAAAIAAGVGFVPEDRREQGLVMDLALDHNAALASLRRLRRFGLIRRSAERALARDWAGRLQLKYGDLGDPATTLSGGNQQKLVLAKVAVAPAVAAHHRRTHPGHRRGHQGRGAPAHRRNWSARASPS